MLLTSCASIYTGKELPSTSIEEIKAIDKSVTFRFVMVGNTKTIGGDHLWIRLNKKEHNNFFSYIEKQNKFKEIVYFKADDGDYDPKSLNTIEKFNRLFPPVFDTDYLVDIYINYPVYYHGSGTGMWGGLFSVLTLGIIPHYYTVKEDYEIKVYSKKSKEPHNVKFKDDYGVLSATWLWVAPSSEAMFRGSKLNRMERNKANYLLKRIESEIIAIEGSK